MPSRLLRNSFALTVSVLLLVSPLTQAGSLFVPFSLDSTEVLPKGVRNLAVLAFTTEITDGQNGFGTVQPIGGGFNKAVTWGDLIKAEKAGYDRNSLQGYVQSKGYAMGDVVGRAVGVVDTRVTTTIPVLAYGVTDRLTLAAVIPILYSNTNVSTGWSANENFNQAISKFAADGKSYRITANQDKLMNVVTTDVATKNYAPLHNESRTDMGDITLAGKYRLIKDDDFALALVPKVILPTGRMADVDKLVDVASGSGVWGLGLSAVTSYEFNGQWMMLASVGYLNQLPTYMAKRVPIQTDSAATPDVDSSTYVKFGDIFTGQIGPKFKVTRLITLGSELGYQYKAPDIYSGDRYEAGRYGWMSIDTEQVMFSSQFGAIFSTVPLYMAKSFPVPFEASLSYANVFSGRNVNITELYSGAISLFF